MIIQARMERPAIGVAKQIASYLDEVRMQLRMYIRGQKRRGRSFCDLVRGIRSNSRKARAVDEDVLGSLVDCATKAAPGLRTIFEPRGQGERCVELACSSVRVLRRIMGVV